MDIHLSLIQGIFLFIGLFIMVWAAYLLWRFIRYTDTKKERKDAIKRSESVILGSVYEKILPFLPDFPYAPKDMVFLGKWVDYIILDGLAEGRVNKVVFLEVKSGTSKLNNNEKAIRDAIENRRVEWKEWRF